MLCDCREREAPARRLMLGARFDCASSTSARAASIRASAPRRSRLLAKRLFDQRGQHRVVECRPPALEQRVLRRGRRRRGQVELRRLWLSHRAAGERGGERQRDERRRADAWCL